MWNTTADHLLACFLFFIDLNELPSIWEVAFEPSMMPVRYTIKLQIFENGVLYSVKSLWQVNEYTKCIFVIFKRFNLLFDQLILLDHGQLNDRFGNKLFRIYNINFNQVFVKTIIPHYALESFGKTWQHHSNRFLWLW